MLILFDHGTPAPLRSFLKDHTVKKTKDLGWDRLSNGELLRAAEEATFEVFDNRQEHSLSTESRGACHCDCGLGQFAMACGATAR
jgi:hypothetical protein